MSYEYDSFSVANVLVIGKKTAMDMFLFWKKTTYAPIEQYERLSL